MTEAGLPCTAHIHLVCCGASHQQQNRNVSMVLLQRPQNAGVESIVISFAQKTFANGTLTSKLHVIELGAPAGQLVATFAC